jgi:hypothetical protein
LRGYRERRFLCTRSCCCLPMTGCWKWVVPKRTRSLSRFLTSTHANFDFVNIFDNLQSKMFLPLSAALSLLMVSVTCESLRRHSRTCRSATHLRIRDRSLPAWEMQRNVVLEAPCNPSASRLPTRSARRPSTCSGQVSDLYVGIRAKAAGCSEITLSGQFNTGT